MINIAIRHLTGLQLLQVPYKRKQQNNSNYSAESVSHAANFIYIKKGRLQVKKERIGFLGKNGCGVP